MKKLMVIIFMLVLAGVVSYLWKKKTVSPQKNTPYNEEEVMQPNGAN